MTDENCTNNSNYCYPFCIVGNAYFKGFVNINANLRKLSLS